MPCRPAFGIPTIKPLALAALVALAASGLGAAACRPPHSAEAQGLRRLTLIEGSGGGEYAPGATVHIEADRMPDSKTFGGWAGLEATAEVNPKSDRVAFTMPDRDLTLTAQWKPASLWAWEPVPGMETVAMAHRPWPVPPDTVGRPAILVLLHDAGQDLRYWQTSAEARLFARAAAARGMGLLAIQSSDPGGRWNLAGTDLAANPDLGRLLNALHSAPFVGPLVFLGIGEGAAFADLAADAFLPLSSVQSAGAILVGGVGREGVMPGGPRMWVLAAREQALVKQEAERRWSELLVGGQTTDFLALAQWPMFPRSFWRLGGMTSGDSVRLHRALSDAGVLDGQGWVIRDPAGLDLSLLPEDLRSAAPDLLELLSLGWGSGAFGSLGTARMLRFAEALAPVVEGLPTPTPTRRAYAGRVEVSGGAAGKGDFGGTPPWYTDREIVPFWAVPDPPGLVFDHWVDPEGRPAEVRDPRARHSSLMVDGQHHLVARFALAPEWRPASRRMDGRDLFFHAPPHPVGLVFFFHGAGGGSQGWVQPANAERWLALRDAVARGYAVAVTESGDRQAAQWSGVEPPEANPDIQHVKAFHAQLVAEGAIAEGLPVFGIGMSNGGGFVSRVADALAWQGAVVYDAACRARIGATTQVPIAWHLSENDRRVSNQDALACHEALRRRGIATEFRQLPPQPLHPLRLQRGPGIGPAEARRVVEALGSAGLLDRMDLQIRAPSTSDWRAALRDQAGLPLAQVAEQLDVCWTEHQFYADYNHLALDFFDRARGATGEPTARAVVTLTPGSTPGGPTAAPPTSSPGASATIAVAATPTPTGAPPHTDARRLSLPWLASSSP